MDIKNVRLDLNAVEDGVWFPIEDGAEVRIAMWGNEKQSNFITEAYKENSTKIDAKMMTNEQAEYILKGQWPFVLTGIRGFTDDGVPVEYSNNLIIDMARNKQYAKFFDRVETIAKDERNFRVKAIKKLGEISPAS